MCDYRCQRCVLSKWGWRCVSTLKGGSEGGPGNRKAELEKILLSREATYQEMIGIGKCAGFFAAVTEAAKEKEESGGKKPPNLFSPYFLVGSFLGAEYSKIGNSTKADFVTLQTTLKTLEETSDDAKLSARVLFEDIDSNQLKIKAQLSSCFKKGPLLAYVWKQMKRNGNVAK